MDINLSFLLCTQIDLLRSKASFNGNMIYTLRKKAGLGWLKLVLYQLTSNFGVIDCF